ncbi:MAG: fumarylacetoacetate hydrolase family protein [Xanthobacteraceae bacterium]
MRLVTFLHDGRERPGIVIDDRIHEINSHRDIKSALSELDKVDYDRSIAVSLAEATLLPPVTNPGKIICVGLNYDDHRRETKRPEVPYPTLFIRWADSHVGHMQPLLKPAQSDRFDYEGELAVVIGKPGRHISKERALEHIAGYSCYNDGSVRDWQKHTSQFTPGKNFTASGAFGPWVVAKTIADPHKLTLTTRLNGVVVQESSTDLLIFDIPTLIAYISTFTNLSTGDVIVSGTPGGVGDRRDPPLYMRPGDVVDVEISNIGTLTNSVEQAR